jgi:glycosyltransferase involved in cell wall biosynthesis
VKRVTVLAAGSDRQADGIVDYSTHLAEALEDASAEARVRTCVIGSPARPGRPYARQRRRMLRQALRGEDVVILQYNPFSWGRWGFAPWLPLELLRLRRESPRPTIVVIVHEPYVPLEARNLAMGAWQRLQVATMIAIADYAFASIEVWAKRLSRLSPRRPVRHLPVGSNLPDMRSARTLMRSRLGIPDTSVVLTTFGMQHPGRLRGYIEQAVNEVARSGHAVTVLNLGADPPVLRALDPAVAVRTPGPLGSRELGSYLSAADLFLAPFIDGISTRRTTVMAALQHGLAVVGTQGPLTDSVFRRRPDAARLVLVGNPTAFADAVRHLVESPAERASLGLAARELYEECFAWPVIANRLRRQLQLA